MIYFLTVSINGVLMVYVHRTNNMIHSTPILWASTRILTVRAGNFHYLPDQKVHVESKISNEQNLLSSVTCSSEIYLKFRLFDEFQVFGLQM